MSRLSKVTIPVILLLCLMAFGLAPATAEEAERIVLSFAGDCTLGGMKAHESYAGGFIQTIAREGFAHPFSGVAGVFAQDDLTLVNLEGTLTDARAAQDKAFVFRGPPAYVQTLTEGSVEAVNIANNHIDDYLDAGKRETLATLADAGIRYSGGGRVTYIDIRGVRIGMTGYSYPHRNTLARLEAYDLPLLRALGCDVIIFSMHAGTEEQYRATLTQQNIARGAIDLGVDIVVGHHPHVLQGVEVYGGKPIFYSLGNFAFGGNVNPKDWDTMIGQVVVERDAQGVRLAQMRIIPCRISASSRLSDFRPVVAQGAQAQAIMAKIERYSPGDVDPSLFVTGTLSLLDEAALPEKFFREDRKHVPKELP